MDLSTDSAPNPAPPSSRSPGKAAGPDAARPRRCADTPSPGSHRQTIVRLERWGPASPDSSARRRLPARSDPSRRAATPPEAPPVPSRDPARWERFAALVLELGVDRERLHDAFPDPQDIEDIRLTPDADLPACARTLAEALATPARAPSTATAARPASGVRCVDCRHFERSSTHPRLGRCGAGAPATAAGGWWDTQVRRCEVFAPADERPGQR